MRTIRQRHAAGQSMVPMADMLTATVGVVIFVLIFTVLAATDAGVVKQLPIETNTNTSAVHFVCMKGRIYFIDAELVDQFEKRAGSREAAMQSVDAFQAWGRRLMAQTVNTADAAVTAKANLVESYEQGRRGYLPRAYVRFTLHRHGGEPANEIGLPTSRIGMRLASLDPKKTFAHFIVTPDGMDAFNLARAQASKLGLQSGWMPQTDSEGVSFGIFGGGGGGWQPKSSSGG